MRTRFEAVLLVPCVDGSIRNGRVGIDGPTLRNAGPIEGAFAPDASEVTMSVPVDMPGLGNRHTHFFGPSTLSTEEQLYASNSVGLISSVKDAEKALRAGFTSIRELQGSGIYLGRAVNEGLTPGPHIHASGAALRPTGGHTDIHTLPIEFVRFRQNLRKLPGSCDGIPVCLAAVRKGLRRSPAVVKVCVSGGVLSDVDDPRHQQFSDEKLRAMLEEPTRAEWLVATHCHGK